MGIRHRNNTTAARNHQNNANTATFHGQHGHILPRFTANTATTSTDLIAANTAKKKPHTGFSPVGVTFLFSYKFHDFVGGFSVRGFYELRF